MRVAILVLAFLPFVYFAVRDQIFHLRGRKVSLSENLLHLALGITLAILFTQALAGHHAAMLGALAADTHGRVVGEGGPAEHGARIAVGQISHDVGGYGVSDTHVNTRSSR